MNIIKRSIGSTFLLIVLGTRLLFAQSEAKPVVSDVLSAGSDIHLSGYLATRLEGATNNRILTQDVTRLVAPFKLENRTESHMWQSEFWGKWFTSAVLAYKYHPEPQLKKVLDEAANALLATQTPDGYIGNYAPDKRLQQWDIWGRKYCMLGLLAYYDLTKNKKMLLGASRVADNLMEDLKKQDGIIVTKGNYRGMAASSVLEPICLLYRYTNNKKYLSFAQEIVKQWETPVGPQLISKANINVAQRFPKPRKWYSPEQGQKAYEMMSCYEGLLELYRLTGDEAYKKAVEDTWENIRRTEINVVGSGASTEMWFGGNAFQTEPVHHYQETCVTVTWLKLNEQLLRLTGDSKYADEAEKTYYNALLGSMSANGATWAKYTPINGQRLPGDEQCGMGLNCCDASGPRGLFTYPAYMVTSRQTGIQINNFAQGNYKVKSPDGQFVNIIQDTGFPVTGTVSINFQINKPETFELYVRVPEWSKKTLIKINDEPVTDVRPGGLAKIKRQWRSGDKLSLELDMRGQVIELGNSVAIKRGPIVLARDAGLESADIAATLKPVADKDGYIALEPVADPRTGYNMVFQAGFIPESYIEVPKGPIKVLLCDYASAGNAKPLTFYRVWLDQLLNPSTK
jgi:hypothetical protein